MGRIIPLSELKRGVRRENLDRYEFIVRHYFQIDGAKKYSAQQLVEHFQVETKWGERFIRAVIAKYRAYVDLYNRK